MSRVRLDLKGKEIKGCKVLRCIGKHGYSHQMHWEIECLICGSVQINRGSYLMQGFQGCRACYERIGRWYQPYDRPKPKPDKCGCGRQAVEEIKNIPLCRECYMAY